MKNKIERFVSVFLCAVCILAFSSVAGTVFAKDKLSLTLEFIDDGEPISGAEFELYYIAGIDENGKFSLTDEFSGYPVDISGADADALKSAAQTLAGYIKRDKLTPIDSGTTNENGLLVFPTGENNLENGLYLVIGKSFKKDGYTYKTEPVLVALPCYNSESGSYVFDVTVDVKHSKDKNNGETTERKVIKLWKNDKGIKRPKCVTVDLLKDGDVYDTVSLNAENNWKYEWKNLPKYDNDGLEIDWEAVEREINDYIVSVSYDENIITLTNEYEPEFPDGKTTTRSVQKIWDDNGYENKRPTSIEVELLKNGKVFDSAELSKSNNWSYTWDELDSLDENGEYITWSLKEQSLSDYTAKTELNGYTFVLTNSYNKPKIPRTGLLWWPVMILAAGGMLFLLIGILLKKRRENEEK